MTDEQNNIDQKLNERLTSLPSVVQKAILSADIEKHLHELANRYKLHLDQWELLENEVMLTLLGFQPAENLEQNIKKVVGVDDKTAAVLARDVSDTVFAPIREELERELSQEAQKTGADTTVPSAPAVVPATPPSPPPAVQAERAQQPTAYQPNSTSTVRKDVYADPYREPPQ